MTSRRRWLAAALAIGTLGMLIRIWLIQQPVGSDDVHYFGEASTATGLADLGDTSNANGLRLAVMALPAVYSHLFDDPGTAFYGTVYTYALVTGAAILAFAWVMAGPRAAALAVGMWATSYVAIGVDTRLVPDNLGTAFAMGGLALIAVVGLRPSEPEPRARTIVILSLAGGFLLWLAFCARESFFVFGGVGVGFALLSRRRWLVTGAVLGGLLVGFVVEYACMTVAFDDGLLRWKRAFAYRESLAEVGAGPDAGAFGGYGVTDLVLRYPRLLASASPVDLMIHLVGLAGVVVWLRRWRDRTCLAKAGAALVAYGFLALAIAGVSPIVPLMREKLRYYVTAAPFLALAAAELLELALFAKLGRGRLARWIDHRARAIGVAVIAGAAMVAAVVVAARGPEFVRNGNDALWNAASSIVDDAEARDRSRTLFADLRTGRVVTILLPRAWKPLASQAWPERFPEPGYVVYDWVRLDADARAGKPIPATHYRTIEHAALVLRQRRAADRVDVFYRGDAPLARRIVDITEPYPASWGGYCMKSKEAYALSAPSPCPDERAVFRFSGADVPWRPRDGAALDGDQFVEVVLVARASRPTTLRATLNWWPPGSRATVTQVMGNFPVGPEAQTLAAWTYLPADAGSFRVVLRGPATVELDGVQTFLLSRDPADRVRQIGGAW